MQEVERERDRRPPDRHRREGLKIFARIKILFSLEDVADPLKEPKFNKSVCFILLSCHFLFIGGVSGLVGSTSNQTSLW